MTLPINASHRFALRAPRADDAVALTALRNLPGVRHGTLAMPFMPLTITSEYLAKPDPNRHIIVAEADGDLVGMASLNRYAGRRAHVAGFGISVADHWQGRGAGTALLAAMVDLADNWLGLIRIELNVFTDNTRAIGLYERFGFVNEGCYRAYALRDGRLIDSFAMARLRPGASG